MRDEVEDFRKALELYASVLENLHNRLKATRTYLVKNADIFRTVSKSAEARAKSIVTLLDGLIAEVAKKLNETKDRLKSYERNLSEGK
jgi:ribosome-associated translation inhibitor RaiA